MPHFGIKLRGHKSISSGTHCACVCATVCGPHTTFNTVATLTALLTALLTAALTAQCVNAMSLEAVRQAGKLAKILSRGRQRRGVRERQGSSGRTERTEGKRG